MTMEVDQLKARRIRLAIPVSLGFAVILSACSSDSSDSANETGGTASGAADSTAGVVCDYVDSTFNTSASVADTSTSTWSCSATDRELAANGLPDHDVGAFPNAGNPNTIATQDVAASITLSPVNTDSATELGGPRGVTGYVLNGVKIDAGTGGSCPESATEVSDCGLANNTGRWNIEAVGQDIFDFGTDENNAHVQPGGAYHYHGMPENFIAKQGGDSSNVTLIGWAADGFPIYGRYGYSVADDASSAIEAMQGSFQHVSTVDAARPSTDTFPLGTFAQDWEYVEGSGDLDECNGRVGVTPEFPAGIYHYYSTDTYPFLQRCVKGEVDVASGPGPGGGMPPPL